MITKGRRGRNGGRERDSGGKGQTGKEGAKSYFQSLALRLYFDFKSVPQLLRVLQAYSSTIRGTITNINGGNEREFSA